MMKTEVTVSMYKSCVEAGYCTMPNCPQGPLTCNYVDPMRQDHPVTYVNWVQIMKFATWMGARLPTEAEWEYAARSQGTQSIYPWGDEEPSNCNLANVYMEEYSLCHIAATKPVCASEDGNTAQGLCDMAGNVYEWLQDEWHDNYENAPSNGSGWCDDTACPINANDDNYTTYNHARIMRGGAHSYGLLEAMTYARTAGDAEGLLGDNFGGRLARSHHE
jgi:formylglycine-generating enzyme required for sulfatase activity